MSPQDETFLVGLQTEQEEKGKKGLCMPCRHSERADVRMLEKDGRKMPPFYLYCEDHWSFIVRHGDRGTKYLIELL